MKELLSRYLMIEHKRRFASPTVLTDSTPFFGSTVGKWDQVFTGGFQKGLEEVKARVQRIDRDAKIDTTAAQVDWGSFYRKMIDRI